MAVKPLAQVKKRQHVREQLARSPLLALALLVALFGLLAGAPRHLELAASIRSLDSRSDKSPAFAKRDPSRAVATAERRDGNSGPSSWDDGFLPPSGSETGHAIGRMAERAERRQSPSRSADWSGRFPRAPPLAA